MSIYSDNTDDSLDPLESDDGKNTMAVLSTLGGGAGDDVLAEGEPLGLDPDAGKAKISGSSLAVGVVVVLGAAVLFGMKMTLGAIGASGDPTQAMAEIDSFMINQGAAIQASANGPLKAPNHESKQVLEELQQDPTKHQVPAEEVETNPFDISKIVTRAPTPTDDPTATPPSTDPREVAIESAKSIAAKFKVDMISGNIVYIDGEMYRLGDEIAKTGFKLESVDGLTCIIRTTDEHRIALRLRYR